ncbi:MAG: hypothetical protein ACTHMM_21225 [Agriterribacter sp.]
MTDTMITENSGKIYRFKLDHNLGFGFAEVYDFTDHSMFDGRVVYVFNKYDQDEKLSYDLSEIRESGIALGPIRLYKFPNTRGLHSWKFISKADNLLIHNLPETKELKGLHWLDDNWDNFKGKWYNSNYDIKELPAYVDYEKVRHLETRIINSPSGVVTKFTMKVILDKKEKVSDYYDLSELGIKNMFVQMVNTYFPLAKTKAFLKQLPTH